MNKRVKLIACIVISLFSFLAFGKIISAHCGIKMNANSTVQKKEYFHELYEDRAVIDIQSTLSYVERDDSLGYARNYFYYVFDYDYYSDDDLLYSGETGRYGDFATGLINNYDEDEDGNDPLLDIYITWEADNPYLEQKIADTNRVSYSWQTAVQHNVSNGTLFMDHHVSTSDSQRPAMWIYEDMLRAFEHWMINAGFNPGAVTAVWEYEVYSYNGCGSACFFPGNDPRIFIPDDRTRSKDTVVHEVAHNYMWNMVQWVGGCPSPHNMFIESNVVCAWSEGWAEFLPLIVNGDQCYDWDWGPCNGTYYDLEAHNLDDNPDIYNFGDAVEGRVAGALCDLVDENNEIYDKTSLEFDDIAYLLAYSPLEENFSDFWESWLNEGYDHFNDLVSSFYLNTIGGGFIYIPTVTK